MKWFEIQIGWSFEVSHEWSLLFPILILLIQGVAVLIRIINLLHNVIDANCFDVKKFFLNNSSLNNWSNMESVFQFLYEIFHWAMEDGWIHSHDHSSGHSVYDCWFDFEKSHVTDLLPIVKSMFKNCVAFHMKGFAVHSICKISGQSKWNRVRSSFGFW